MGIHFMKYSTTGTLSGGDWSGNTEKAVPSILRQVFVKAASSDTTFDLTVTDNSDRIVRKWTSQTEVVNDLTPMPAEGIYTVAVTNGSADEAFTVYLCFSENL